MSGCGCVYIYLFCYRVGVVVLIARLILLILKRVIVIFCKSEGLKGAIEIWQKAKVKNAIFKKYERKNLSGSGKRKKRHLSLKSFV